jgi:serine/threonine protein kinase
MTAHTTLRGSRLGPYDIIEELGHGGMGVVYRALDVPLQRVVALKVLAPRYLDDAVARARFQQEIKAAVAVEHPHVVPIYNAGFEDRHFFLAMRYVKGCDLGELIHTGGPLPETRAMRLVGQVASALSMVHEQGLIHRDIKPQNVLVWHPDCFDEHAFLTDFGIAKALGETVGLTRMGALGTPGYMAPELLKWEPATPACDQYSLACLTYELLTGHLPFPEDADNLGCPRPMRLFAQVSLGLCSAVERALQEAPEDRFSDVQAFVAASAAASDAFHESRAIRETMAREQSESQKVSQLYAGLRLSDERIAEIADVEKSEVVKMRRRAARQSIVGE